jgi:hypothetical protein
MQGYPRLVRRVFAWYDRLTDRQRVEYAIAAMLFLLACAGYFLGLGSTMLLSRVEAQDAAFGITVMSTPTSEPTLAPTAAPPGAAPTQAAPPVAVAASPTAEPLTATPTPFTIAQIPEVAAVPRAVVARRPAPAVPAAPLGPAVDGRPTPTAAKPRNVEDTVPEPPAASLATRTPAPVRPLIDTTAAEPTPTPLPVGEVARSAGEGAAAADRTPSPQPSPTGRGGPTSVPTTPTPR